MSPLVGAVEAGGTKIGCAIGSGPDDLRDELRFPTTDPVATVDRIIEYFEGGARLHGELAAIGVGTFGPVDLRVDSPTYGRLQATPKEGWRHADLVGPLRRALGLPVALDTDVNAAALGEWRWGAAQGLDTFVYLTIGTGIGGGGMVGGRLLHGLTHPEMGHMRLPRRADDSYAGACPFHADCWEGLASGPAIAGRWGQAAGTLAVDHPAWELEAHYLALALMNVVCVLSPQRIVLGGGVMEQAQLFPMVRASLVELLGGYVESEVVEEEIASFVVPPVLGDKAGVLGAIALAQRSLEMSAST